MLLLEDVAFEYLARTIANKKQNLLRDLEYVVNSSDQCARELAVEHFKAVNSLVHHHGLGIR